MHRATWLLLSLLRHFCTICSYCLSHHCSYTCGYVLLSVDLRTGLDRTKDPAHALTPGWQPRDPVGASRQDKWPHSSGLLIRSWLANVPFALVRQLSRIRRGGFPLCTITTASSPPQSWKSLFILPLTCCSTVSAGRCGWRPSRLEIITYMSPLPCCSLSCILIWYLGSLTAVILMLSEFQISSKNAGRPWIYSITSLLSNVRGLKDVDSSTKACFILHGH